MGAEDGGRAMGGAGGKPRRPRLWALMLVGAALVGTAGGVGVALLLQPAATAVPRMPRPVATEAPSEPAPTALSPPPAPDPLTLPRDSLNERRERDRQRRRQLARQRREREEQRERERQRQERRRTITVQRRLVELGYYVGPVDGEQGPQTTSAVMALQKVNGLVVDGIVGPATLAALDDPVVPALRGGAPTRIEIDLDRQVLYSVVDGALERIVPVSSGSGQTYTTSTGGTARSLTPVGTYAIQRTISGVREADLGILYDPMYFYGGWAIHGSDSVPAYPASHGCVRVTRWDALWLFPRAPVGTQVVLYGGTHVFAAGSDAPGTDAPAGDT